ncbi:MAG: diguanylate cyclase [Fibromonadales bacterium]|nr:diguanylate cyclase [Fibromonadales bacterium]
MIAETPKRRKETNKSLMVFLSMVVILISILLFTAFLVFNFRTFLSEQAKENVYLENANILSEISLHLKKIEYSLMESRLVSRHLIETGGTEELRNAYIHEKIKLNSDIEKIHISSNNDNNASSWFLSAKKANGKIAFTLPYHDSSSNKILMDFSINTYNNKGQEIGVVAHSIYSSRLSRELQKLRKSPQHQIYISDYSQNLITSTEHDNMKINQILDIDEIGLGKYKKSIFSYSSSFAIDSGYYIFFTPIFERNFVLITKIPLQSFYAANNFFFNKKLIIPISIFTTIIIFVSVFVILLMGREQRKKRKIEVDSLTDPLTKLYNRRYFEDNVKILFEKMKAAQKPISLMMLDIDFFKQCNDTYGHSMGDSVLKSIASVLIKYARREDDFVTRLGGEEFGVLLVGTNKEDTIKIAESIREETERTKTKIRGTNNHISVTISIGIANVIPNEEYTFQMLYDTADKLLYEAKKSGRNRVCY